MSGQDFESHLQSLKRGRPVIIRDDLYNFSDLQRILEIAAGKKLRVALLDTGRFTPEEIELLAEFHFSLYTSDSARTDFQVLSLLSRILRKRGRNLFYWLQGEVDEASPLLNHLELFKSVFISSRERPRNLETLARLAEQISESGGNFVYYHHGNLEENLAEIGLKNCWIHVSNKNLAEEAELMILDGMAKVRENKGRLIVHVERSQSYRFLRLLSDRGAFLIFNLPPVEPSSKVFSLVETWQKKKLPEEAFYLYKEFMA